jgi:hypothetical protein
MSKQTATQYLIEEIKNDSLVQAKSTEEWNEVFRIAKEMEREQIIDFCQMWEDSPLEKYDCKEDLFIELYGK